MQAYAKLLSILIAIMIAALPLMSCSDSEDSADEVETGENVVIENQVDPNAEFDIVPDRNGISFAEEDDGAVIEKVNKDPSEYVGTWEATSDKSSYLYGNIEVQVYKNGTWAAVITDEKLKGKWTDHEDHIHLDGDFFSFDLAFDKSGKLIMIETGDNYVFNTVLTKK